MTIFLSIWIFSLSLLSPPFYTKVYEMADLVRSPRNFDNAPTFSLSVGMTGSVPFLANHPKVQEINNKRKIQNIVYAVAETYFEKEQTTVVWKNTTMIVFGSHRLHSALEIH